MTGFLASVQNALEAAIVLDGGASIVDAKHPGQGALGALPMHTIEDIVKTIQGRVPVSATVGDLGLDDPRLITRIIDMEEAQVDYIKIGLFKPHEAQWLDALAALPKTHRAKRILVVLADQGPWAPPPFATLKHLGFAGVMLDTADKDTGHLRACLPEPTLRHFVDSAKKAGLLVGLAGKLRIEDIAPLSRLQPDYLGFRSALCRQSNRRSSVDRAAVDTVSHTLGLTQPLLAAH